MADSTPTEIITRTEQYQRQVNYFDRWQRLFLLIGTFYDGFFGVALFAAPIWTTTLFHLLIPGPGKETLWVTLTGILLIIVASCYFLAARNPSRYLGIVAIAIVGKIWSVGYYLYYVYKLGAPPAFLIYAGLDFVFFFLHIWACGPDRWRRVKESFAWKDLYQ